MHRTTENIKRSLSRIMAVMALVLCLTQLQAQRQIELRGYLGETYYQGDLSPLPIALSFSKGHTAFSASAGFRLNRFFSVHGKFMKARLSGTDADAANIARRRRNLSFETSIYEIGVSTELHFNALFKGLDKYGIAFYATSGVNMFHFNPRAFYNEQWYALQPLGTEGQGGKGLDKGDKYSLNQINIPYGIGTKFNIGDRFALGLEITARVTFTDYIDDVSGTYVSYEALLNTNGRDAANLANRTGEFLNSDVVMSSSGTARGDVSDNDWYLYAGMFFSYTLGVTPSSMRRR